MNQMQNELLSALNTLQKTKCWGIVVGEGTGSAFCIDLGGKILRSRQLLNPHLTEEQRKYSAELSLFVSCAWRLDSDTEVICGATDSNENDGPMIRGLTNIVNLSVQKVEVLFPSLDLTLLFDNSLWLRIFCDQTNKDEDYDNYSFFTNDRVYTVKAGSILACKQRAR